MSNTDKDTADFLPDALALRHERLPPIMRGGIVIMCAVFCCFLLFASFAHVDVIVMGSGKLVSSHPTVVLKPLERTVIKEIKTAVGERVARGQVLATFDPVFSNADLERLQADTARLEARLQRLRCEMSGSEYAPKDMTGAEVKLEYKLFGDRRNFYDKKMKAFSSEIESLEKTVKSLEENVELQKRRLSIFREIESMLHKAGNARAVSPRDLKDAEINRMQLEADIKDKENSILITEKQIHAKKNEKEAFGANWEIEIGQDLVKTGSDLDNARKELAKARQMADYVELRAPENALVHEIAPISRGSAIREAETLFTLVPLDGKLEAEIKIKAEDIGKVSPGDPARIKISAYPFQKYGTLPGTVRVLSGDSFLENQENSQENGAFYMARIALDESGNEWLRKRLMPGMELQGDIRIGTRSILEYLVHPIIKSLDEAIREP